MEPEELLRCTAFSDGTMEAACCCITWFQRGEDPQEQRLAESQLPGTPGRVMLVWLPGGWTWALAGGIECVLYLALGFIGTAPLTFPLQLLKKKHPLVEVPTCLGMHHESSWFERRFPCLGEEG